MQTRDSAVGSSKLYEIYGDNMGWVLQNPELLTWVCPNPVPPWIDNAVRRSR